MSKDEQHTEQASQHDLVVVGSSAGGIEALSVFVRTLPADFSAPIVLAQHLDPTRPSTLGDILARHSKLPIKVIMEHSQLEPGQIYVVPANRHVAIRQGHVELEGDHAGRPRPSVDLLLSTAAAEYGERLIAVILTGSGSDGASGAVDVKNAGGTVIVQNPHTARYSGMPLSLPPSIVDAEADLEQIGPLIYELLHGGSISHPEANEKAKDVLPEILAFVNRQAKIDFRQYKTTTILRRINRRMTVTRNRTMHDYAHYLEEHPEEVGELVQAFLINVTQFFRDTNAFRYLKSEILPLLIAQARESDRVLRIWSAGCATGEEPYSLAILLADLLGKDLSQWSIKIFATDIDEAAVNFARRGLYSESLLNSMPAEYRERYFERVDHGYSISKTLRQMVIFGQQDLARSAPFPRIDLVLCRNVLIYFTPELQEYVLNQFAFSLSPTNGFLFLGKAETVHPSLEHFEVVNKQWKIYRCIQSSMPLQRRLSDFHRPSLKTDVGNQLVQATAYPAADEEHAAPQVEIGQLRRLNEVLLRFLPIGVVVIDRSYHILTANSPARRLLGLRDVNNSQDFLHAVRGIPYSEVRSAIDTVFRERSTVTLSEIELDAQLGGDGRHFSLSIALIQVEAGTPDAAMISVTDITEQVQIRRQLEVVHAEQAQLVEELSTANKRLNEMNKELIDANEELQITNEELVLTHEELQATIEEFETTNEELQATNEELETNNEELQATNEELETTNEEVRARSAELQALTSMLESERARLGQMVELAPFYVIVLRGPDLLVEAFNSHYAQMLGEQPVRNRPLVEVYERFWGESGMTVVDAAREVYLTDSAQVIPRMLTYMPGERGQPQAVYFDYTIVPTHTTDGRVDGVLIYALDVTEQRAREMAKELRRLQLIFEHADQVALGFYDAQTAELLMASPRYLDILARANPAGQETFIGTQWQGVNCIEPKDEAIAAWERVMGSRIPVRLPEAHSYLVCDDRETVWNWSLTPIMDTEQPDVVRFMLLSAVEITDQVRAREEVERLDQIKDEFLSLASHELRTPLTSLVGYTGLLRRLLNQPQAEHQPDRKQRMLRLITTLGQQLTRLNQLIDDLVDVGRLQSGKFTLNKEQQNLVETIERAVAEARMLSSQHTIQLSLPAGDEPLYVEGDEGRLIQVVLNLVQNAITYADSPRIDLRLCRVHNEATNTDFAQIEVQDYGIGITLENLESIFDRFYQVVREDRLSRNGLGLGLFISKQIVEQHGGTLTVESEVSKGSTFTVRLPLLDSERPGAPQGANVCV